MHRIIKYCGVILPWYRDSGKTLEKRVINKYISSFLLLYVLSDFNFNFKNILNLFFGVKKDTLYLCINNHFTFAYLSKRCSSI